MVEIAPNFKVERFELNIYETATTDTDTNDTVIARFLTDDEAEKNKIMETASMDYKGCKYKLTDYTKKSCKNKTGVF